MTGHSGDMACPSHLVPFEIVRNGLHFCSLQYYFVRCLVEPLHAKQATKKAHMELVKLFHMSGVNCPGFAGIEKHRDDCCCKGFNFCGQTQTISIPDTITQLSKSRKCPGDSFFTSSSAVAATERTLAR